MSLISEATCSVSVLRAQPRTHIVNRGHLAWPIVGRVPLSSVLYRQAGRGPREYLHTLRIMFCRRDSLAFGISSTYRHSIDVSATFGLLSLSSGMKLAWETAEILPTVSSTLSGTWYLILVSLVVR
jgi:hypothetical protein